MKKKLLLSLTAVGIAVNCFSQAPCCKVEPCKTPDTIYLCYDTCAKKITHQSRYGLAGDKTYIFQIQNVDDALIKLKGTSVDISRSVIFPTGFIIPNGNTTTGKISNFEMNLDEPAFGLVQDNISNLYFFQRYNFDYNILQYIYTVTQKLSGQLNNHPLAVTDLHKQANNLIDSVQAKISSLSALIVASPDTIHRLQEHIRRDTDKNEVGRLNNDLKIHQNEIRFYDKLQGMNLHDPAVFNDFVTRTIANYEAKVETIENENDNARTITMDQLSDIVTNDKLLAPNLPFIAKAPAIIGGVVKAATFINSDIYRITQDYLQLNFTLLKPKYSDKPDTLSKNKLNFYKIHYWKWLDVSAGFFYDDLASAAYYFKNTVATKELKSSADVSVGALAHSYYVIGSAFKIGPCLGAGVSLLDGKSKYLGGISILVGRSNEWAFSGGYALASLPQMSNLYATNTITTTTTVTTSGSSSTSTVGTTPSTGTTTTTGTLTTTTTAPIGTTGTVNTYNKYQGGFFFGITYSFLKL